MEKLLAIADRAPFTAKGEGRNLVRMAARIRFPARRQRVYAGKYRADS